MKHLYIHIPFCSRRCTYCDFSIAVRRKIPEQRFVEAIRKEYKSRKSAGDFDEEPLKTLYLGGGTPSLLSAETVSSIVARIMAAESRGDSKVEVTMEANPEHVTAEVAEAWAAAGINRVSLGAQSFDNEILAWMHRTHAADQIKTSVENLRRAGIGSISLDLLIGLPPALEHDVASDLSQALDMDPDHLSIYSLTLEPRTKLARWVSNGRATLADDEITERDFLLAHDLLAGVGYEHYEVSNYARPGQRSLHNSAYWDGSRYVGLGPSAHSFDGEVRRWNVAPWAEYERAVSGGSPEAGREAISVDQAWLERLYLGLRSDGIGRREMQCIEKDVVGEAERAGWAAWSGDRWRLTPTGWLRIDELVIALTTSAEGG